MVSYFLSQKYVYFRIFGVIVEYFLEYTVNCACTHVVCSTCRQNNIHVKNEKSSADAERLKPMNGSIDSYSVNLTATNDDVNFQWHQQQRQQLVM